MNESTQSHNEQDDTAGCADNDKLHARRRLLKAGVSAAPIVLTLASRPVLAWHCKPPSAYASANLSHRTQQQWPDEHTKYIRDWINDSWPSPYIKTDIKDKWGRVTTPATTMVGAGLGSSTATMLSRLQGGSNLEKYVIAALLNIAIGKVPGECLTATELRKMFNEGQTGSYSPPDSAGVTWGPTQIVTYLYDNWIVRG